MEKHFSESIELAESSVHFDLTVFVLTSDEVYSVLVEPTALLEETIDSNLNLNETQSTPIKSSSISNASVAKTSASILSCSA